MEIKWRSESSWVWRLIWRWQCGVGEAARGGGGEAAQGRRLHLEAELEVAMQGR